MIQSPFVIVRVPSIPISPANIRHIPVKTTEAPKRFPFPGILFFKIASKIGVITTNVPIKKEDLVAVVVLSPMVSHANPRYKNIPSKNAPGYQILPFLNSFQANGKKIILAIPKRSPRNIEGEVSLRPKIVIVKVPPHIKVQRIR